MAGIGLWRRGLPGSGVCRRHASHGHGSAPGCCYAVRRAGGSARFDAHVCLAGAGSFVGLGLRMCGAGQQWRAFPSGVSDCFADSGMPSGCGGASRGDTGVGHGDARWHVHQVAGMDSVTSGGHSADVAQWVRAFWRRAVGCGGRVDTQGSCWVRWTFSAGYMFYACGFGGGRGGPLRAASAAGGDIGGVGTASWLAYRGLGADGARRWCRQ